MTLDLSFLSTPLDSTPATPIHLAEGELDPRLKNLSYSSLLTLHSCPRRFQLYKLQAPKEEEEGDSSVTFAFGHVVGLGIQLALQGKSLEEITLELFMFWKPDLLAEITKKRKSFFLALHAVRIFIAMREAGYLEEYELAYVSVNGESVPAVELSYRIQIQSGFNTRGFVDAVLVSRDTGQILVLELKTTGSKTVDAATYKNSSQAVGYSTVLEHIFPGTTEYKVLYLVYSSTEFSYTPLEFDKGMYERAAWITDLILDSEQITRYAQLDYFPTRGESCYNYFRQCEYFTTCKLQTAHLTTPLTSKVMDAIAAESYMYEIDLKDLLNQQLENCNG